MLCKELINVSYTSQISIQYYITIYYHAHLLNEVGVK